MRIYTYGALLPIEGREIVEAQLRAANRYYNRLVEIERAKRKAYREIEASVVSDETRARLAVAERAEKEAAAAVSAAKAGVGKKADVKQQVATLKAARQALKDARAAYKTEAASLKEATARVKAAREKEKAARKIAGRRDRDDAAIAAALVADISSEGALAQRLHASESECAVLARKARAESGIPWGTYSLVEDAVLQAAGDSPGDPDAPRFHRFDGGGRIGAPQIVGGAALDELATDTRFRLVVLPIPDGASKRMAARRHALASIRVGTADDGDPIWAAWPVLMHRPLPDGGIVKRAWALKRKVGSTERWEIQITVDDANVKRQRGAQASAGDGEGSAVSASRDNEHKGADRAVAVDFGWRRSSGYRVGYLVDLDGKSEAICAPLVSFAEGRRRRTQWAKTGRVTEPVDEMLVKNNWHLPMAEALDYLDGIRAVRDRHFDVAIGFVREHLAREGRENLPDWLREATSSIHQWRGHGRLVGLLRQWATAEHWRPEDDTILDGIRAWEKKDQHLWDWEAHGRERILRARREHYRVIAARIARDYDKVILPKEDLRDFARAPAPENGDPSDGRYLRVSQRMCAPSELKEAIVNAAKRERCTLVEQDPADDSRTCHRCGSVETIGADLWHACTACGATWDRDFNACVNRLRKAGYDPTRAAERWRAQQDHSQGSPPTGGAGKTAA